MLRLRVLFVISLVILGVLLAQVFLRPMTGSEEKYSEASRASLLQTKNGWILQFDIVNHESEESRYTIDVIVDGNAYQDSCLINPGGLYTYIHQISRDRITEGKVNIDIRKDNEDVPFEQGTYYLK